MILNFLMIQLIPNFLQNRHYLKYPHYLKIQNLQKLILKILMIQN